MKEQINPDTIESLAEAKAAIRALLNMVEELLHANQALRSEVQELKDEVNRLKGEQGKPEIKASKKAVDKKHSSEPERRESKAWKKAEKRPKIIVHQEKKVLMDKSELPADAEFKGYAEVVVQDIIVTPNNTCFQKEKYYSASEQKSYMAPMPAGYEGEFGPGLKALVLALYHGSGMTEPKISEFLEQFDIMISDGQISNILTKEQTVWHAEKEAIVQAGLASTKYQHSDDTATRVNGVNHHCHILCNEYYTAFFTRSSKSRLTIIHLLQRSEMLLLLLNQETQQWLNDFNIPQKTQRLIAKWPQEVMLSAATMTMLMERDLSSLNDQQQARIWEAAALTAYAHQEAIPQVDILLTDDAPQFGQITPYHALCWIHEGRHYKKLTPFVEHHRHLLDDFLTEFWTFYKSLLDYRLNPCQADAQRLKKRFHTLFSTSTGYDQLDQRIARTKDHAAQLLLVLDFPEIPLHNNPAELGARQRVRKRIISFGPRSQEGLEAWDTFSTLAETAKKLGVSFYAYLYDRVSKSYAFTSLAERIAQHALTTSTATY
jgi:hypothetical protein